MTKKKRMPIEPGYTIDLGITHKYGRQQQLEKILDFCPKCNETVELEHRPNLYNPKKTVKVCGKCGIIHGSELWVSLRDKKKEKKK